MVLKTNCRNCKEFFKYNGKFCNMGCSLKKDNKIYPKNYTMKEIQECLANNLGVRIRQEYISKYSREIKLLIGK